MNRRLALLVAFFATGVDAQAASAPARKLEARTDHKAERKTGRKGTPAKKARRKGGANR